MGIFRRKCVCLVVPRQSTFRSASLNEASVFLRRRDAKLFDFCILSARESTREDSQRVVYRRTRVSIFQTFLSGFPSNGEVLGEIFDYEQYIIQPETLCRTD